MKNIYLELTNTLSDACNNHSECYIAQSKSNPVSLFEMQHPSQVDMRSTWHMSLFPQKIEEIECFRIPMSGSMDSLCNMSEYKGLIL